MYATLQQMVDRFGLEEVAELLSDEETLITEALLRDALAGDTSEYTSEEQAAAASALERADDVLTNESQLIDSMLASRYKLPLQNPDKQPLVSCCLALSRAALADDGDNISTTMKEERNYWRGWLSKIAKGEASLVDEIIVGSAGASHRRTGGTLPSSICWETY